MFIINRQYSTNLPNQLIIEDSEDGMDKDLLELLSSVQENLEKTEKKMESLVINEDL